jgi:hypothetical protein
MRGALSRQCKERSDAATQFDASKLPAAGLLRFARNDGRQD